MPLLAVLVMALIWIVGIVQLSITAPLLSLVAILVVLLALFGRGD